MTPRVLALTLVFSLLAPAAYATAKRCAYNGVAFKPTPKAFLAGLKRTAWKSEEGELASFFDNCSAQWERDLQNRDLQNHNNQEPTKPKVKAGDIDRFCGLKGEGANPFEYMRLVVRKKQLREVSLTFSTSKRPKATDVVDELEETHGKANAATEYASGDATHRLRLWRTEACQIVLDTITQGNGLSDAVALVFHPANYKPIGGPEVELFKSAN